MLGFAVACIGMRVDDFCSLTIEEYKAAAFAYHEKVQEENKEQWERARLMTAISIQPHIKNNITPQKLLPFPWEKQEVMKEEKLTIEERKKRGQVLLNKLGRYYE